MKCAVIGSPVKQSLSPVIHNYWLNFYKIDAAYTAQEIAAHQLDDFTLTLRTNDWRGCNVTIPHKEKIIPFLDKINSGAEKIGAVNTVVNDNGVLTGYNTDGFGFTQHLIETLNTNAVFSHPVMILGAGGAARGIIAALIDKDVNTIIIVNRDQNKALQLQKEFGGAANIQLCDWGNYHSFAPNAGLLVNTTSLGMTGQPDLDFDLSLLPDHAAVYDIVYKPLETNLLRAARARGLKTIDGLGMLIHQARQSFELWFGILPDMTEDLTALIHEKISV